jgi:N-methylhydantoinase B/oxoprolinase/acetone carboxylase alpha subunit
MKFNPAQISILWNQLVTAVDEAATVLVRTSFSSVIRDFHDYACALFDRKGRMLAQSTQSTPGLLGVLPFTIPNFLRHCEASELSPGDVMITNDPWLASGHLIDITVAAPVFRRGMIVGYMLTVVHHLNVGGRLATLESRDIYEEGLKIPITHLYRAGEPQEVVFDFLRANVREPEKVVGDVRAQVAATHAASQKLLAIMDRAGLDDLEILAQEIISRSEKSMRDAVYALPDGEYAHQMVLRDIAGPDSQIDLRLKIRVEGDTIILDYDGSSPQVSRAVNVTLNFTRSYSYYPLKCVLDPLVPNNEGCLRPIEIRAPEASVLNASFPAATWGRTIVAHMLTELITLALSKVVPERLISCCGSTPLWYGNFTGRYKDGRSFYMVIVFNGGMGARALRDGIPCLPYPCNVASIPVEVTESDSPILIETKEFLRDSAGAGRFRGGVGQRIDIRVPEEIKNLEGPILAGVRGGRMGVPIVGLRGGRSGIQPKVTLNGTPMELGTQIELNPGDRIHTIVPGGAGYGNPLERPVADVLEDVKNGIVSIEHARRDYGVHIDPETGEGKRES